MEWSKILSKVANKGQMHLWIMHTNWECNCFIPILYTVKQSYMNNSLENRKK